MYSYRLMRLFLLFALFCATQSAQASAVDSQTELKQQREVFLKAEYAAKRRHSSEYQQLYRQLDGYPLQPYIELTYLSHHTNLKNKSKIRDFLARFEQTPLEWPLRKKWLFYLAKRDKQALFLQDFRPSSDTELLCYQLRFALNAGAPKEDIFSQVDHLWIAKKSQPKACDPLFSQWQKAGHRSEDKVWQRLVLAASKGDHTLIPYLKRLTPENEKYLADLWYKARRNPHTVSRLKYFPKSSDKEKAILLYGIKRLIWRDSQLALRSWAEMQKQYRFTEDEKHDVAKVFAVRLAKAGDDKANLWLDKVPPAEMTDQVVQWRIADSLRRSDWQDALSVLQALPPRLAEEEAWSYWLARALEQTGNHADARRFFVKVAKERHYYGFLAATLIGQPPNLADTPLVFSDDELLKIDQMAAAKRALEFRNLGRFREARREWNYLDRKLDRREKLAAAKWANQNGWYDRAIFTLAQQKYWDDVNLRFPLAYKDTLSYHSNRNQLEPSFIFAIARRESSFMTDAYSPAGAYGLMQMLPSTAKFIAKKKVKRTKLFDSDTNVQYATDYVKYLLESVQGNEVIAAAAYNAGINRVKVWLKTPQPMPADIWIETIPYKETREYVKSVMAYRQIYSELLGSSENKFKALANMQIGL